MKRERVLSRGGNHKVNELIYYGRSADGNINLHIASHENTSNGEKLRLLREGLKKLAEEVNNDSGIQEVSATSWIVAAAPSLLERLGFTLHGEISAEFKQAHFAEETRPVHYASISRSVLLEKYLNTKTK
jgi:hypothetical protein